MIVCPIDNLQLKKEDHLLNCLECAYRAIKRNGNVYSNLRVRDGKRLTIRMGSMDYVTLELVIQGGQGIGNLL